MRRFEGIIFIIIFAGLYFATDKFVGGLLGLAFCALVALFLTFLIVRSNWEDDKLKKLNTEDKEKLDSRISSARDKLAKSREFFNKKVEESNYEDPATVLSIMSESFDDAYIITVGILSDLDKNSCATVLDLFRAAKRAPFDKQLASKLDKILHTSFQKMYSPKLTTSIPFPRAYKKIVREVYVEHINNDGVLTRAGQLKTKW